MYVIEPPVASIGSSTITGRCLSLGGSDSMYGKGRWVSSSRATPTKPTSASGIAACASSIIPSPARNTGTSSGGSTSRRPNVSARGVRILTGAVGTSRVASYTSTSVSARNAARKPAASVRSSRSAVSRAAANG
ncbi:hypothetical protein MSTO_26490 [Mycobacterium stomatepiae]|uniref:Uncharacterized protein n=1 Tax=Mycobacterium stomatepiae TaxID=470076 RepID=A0A7I7Q7X6_9MYCO|nr:hypothetical protein MSTO_26490 [Mycobacterium stomatepiae]